MVTITTIASGLGGAIGCRYNAVNDKLYFVEYSTGKVSVINKASTAPNYQVLGTGYTDPEDIALSSDGIHAYVTERSGDLVYVKLSSANRSSATVVCSGMNTPQQIALDEAHGYAYIVEYANPGKLWRVTLSGGSKTALLSSLNNAVGVLITSDSSTAYVSQQPTTGGQIIGVDLMTLHTQILVSNLTNPFFLTWADASQTSIITTERDPANRITQLDLSTNTTHYLATAVPFRPSSVSVMSPGILFLCSDIVISEVNLLPYTPSSPLLMGIGFVPSTNIIGGYADTTTIVGYPYPFKDSPFSGTPGDPMPILINQQKAYSGGARYYKLLVDGVEPRQSYTDALWNGSTWVSYPVSPDSNGFYALHTPAQQFYLYGGDLGYMLDTSGVTNGLHTITVNFYNTATTTSPVTSTDSIAGGVQIDNSSPTASIDGITQYANKTGGPPGVAVPTCAVVNAEFFTFNITATSPQQHLLSWSLTALWGDNQSLGVDSDSYSPAHVTPTKLWAGFTGTVPIHPPPPPQSRWDAFVPAVPPVPPPADPTYSLHCAHTFRLGVWDRVINGVYYLHYSEYDKSITIWVPPPPIT